MGGFHCDQHIPQYFNNVAVTNGTAITGNMQQLAGLQGMSIQIVPTNGAAGTLYADGSNSRAMDGNINWQNFTNTAISANTPAVVTFGLADQLLLMHLMRLRFVPSASGNLLVAITGRVMMY